MPAIDSLPRLVTPFIGRTHDIAEIGQVLLDPACRLLTLVGPGGSGKTRLSIEVAARQADAFANGVYFVPLAPLDSVESIVPTIATTLGVSLGAGESPANQLLTYLRDRRLLLVLDNFEHLLDGTPLVTQILEAAPAVKVLTTSREALALEEEWVRQVNGMRFPGSDDKRLPSIEDYSAIRLFVERARRVRADFSLADEQAAVIRICQLVEGLPLAIELAAVWLKTMTCQQIADEIQRDMDFLTSPLRNAPERHRSIRAIFDYSWCLLTDDEQITFRKLSVFRGAFTLDAAFQIADITRQCLNPLVDKSLVQMTPTGHYGLHELLRQYAEERLEATNETAITQEAHSCYYAAFMHARESDLKGKRQLAAINEIKAEWDNVRTACAWVLDQRDFALMEQLLEGLFRYGLEYRLLEVQSLWRHALEVFAPQPAEEAHPVWGRLLARTAQLFVSRGISADPTNDIAQQQVEMALAIARQHDDLVEVGYCLFSYGLLLTYRSDFSGALRWAEDSLTCLHPLNDGFRLAEAYSQMASSYQFLGQIETSLAWSQRYLNQSRLIENKSEEGWALYQISFSLAKSGRTTEAETYLHSAKGIMAALGNQFGLSTCESALSWIAFFGGNMQQAAESSTTVLQLASDSGNVIMGVGPLTLLGMIECLEGHYDRAKATLDRAYGLAASSNKWLLEFHQRAQVIYCCGVGDYRTTHDHLEAIGSAAISQNDLPMLTFTLPIQAVLLAYQRQPEQAAERLGLAARYPADVVGWMAKWALLTQLRADLELELGMERFHAAWERGKTLDLETTVAEPLDASNSGQPQVQRAPMQALAEPLSDRELEVLQLMADGLSNAEIAQKLYLSVGTVKVHARNIYGKLGVSSRTQAVVEAQKLKLL